MKRMTMTVVVKVEEEGGVVAEQVEHYEVAPRVVSLAEAFSQPADVPEFLARAVVLEAFRVAHGVKRPDTSPPAAGKQPEGKVRLLEVASQVNVGRIMEDEQQGGRAVGAAVMPSLSPGVPDLPVLPAAPFKPYKPDGN